MKITPSVQARYEKTGKSGTIGKLYFDVDGKKETGCRGVLGFKYGNIEGYEVAASLTLGIYSGRRGTGCLVSYHLQAVNEKGKFGFSSRIKGGEQMSHKRGSRIAHGRDGVEFSIPLKILGLRPGRTVRLLLVENAHVFEKEGYSEARVALQK
jgi:hypothetical protein